MNSLLISVQIDARSLVPLITGESMPRSSVGASAAVSSSAGQTLTNKGKPAREGKGTAQLKRLGVGQRRERISAKVISMMLCCRPHR